MPSLSARGAAKSMLLTALVLSFCSLATPPLAPCADGKSQIWQNLGAGLQFAELPLRSREAESESRFRLEDGLSDNPDPGADAGEADARVAILRIDPEKNDFLLCAVSQDSGEPKSLKDWAKEKNLAAAINASMYLPDNRTSTGYMRQGTHVNNGRIVERFGAFFVAGPRRPGIPRARIIERDEPGWREKIGDYDLVIQNYRMSNSQGRVLWSPGGPLYAISAVAQDKKGRVLFIHAREPVEARDFARQLLSLPLDIGVIMYVEGGSQAGLLVNSGGALHDYAGTRALSFFVTGNLRAALPNVLGIKAREKF